MIFGPLGLDLVPTEAVPVPLPQADKGRGDVSAQPLLCLLAGPEAGESGQSGLPVMLPAPTLPGAWGLSSLIGVSDFKLSRPSSHLFLTKALLDGS